MSDKKVLAALKEAITQLTQDFIAAGGLQEARTNPTLMKRYRFIGKLERVIKKAEQAK